MGASCSSCTQGEDDSTDRLLEKDGPSANAPHHCMEIWRLSSEVFALPKEERLKYATAHYKVSSDGPFPPGTFDETAPISKVEAAAVMLFFAIITGGPVLVLCSLIYVLVVRHWIGFVVLLISSLVLALHPLPNPDRIATSWLMLCMYKYFTYRWIWYGDTMDSILDERFIIAGVPHGVLPIGNWLGIVSFSVMEGHPMTAAAATVTLYTPFLRYFTAFTPATDVSKESLVKTYKEGSSIGIVPDGIAGIFAKQGTDEVALKDRKGLARLSLLNGIAVLPVYSLGNSSIYSVWSDPCGIMKNISEALRISIFVFWGRFGPIPRRANVTSMLAPLLKPEKIATPTNDDVDDFHEELLEGLDAAFEANKDACGAGHRAVTFI